MIKLIAIDVDGTLLSPNHQITPQVKQAIRRAKQAGVKVVISTGRTLQGIKKILEELELVCYSDYVVTSNGALVQHATGEILRTEKLSTEDVLELEAMARKIGVHMHASTDSGIYTSNRDIGKYTVQEAYLQGLPLYFHQPEEIASYEVMKVMMIDPPIVLDSAIDQIPVEFFERYSMVKSMPYYLDVMNKKASKGSGIRYLAEKLGLIKEELMAIGDQENDSSMLEAVGYPVAMGNGHEDLKKIARYITKTNEESGVAYAINEWVFRNEKNLK